MWCDVYFALHVIVTSDWLSVCRVTSVIAMVFLILAAVLFAVVMLCIICQLVSINHFVTERIILYATPVTCVLAGNNSTKSEFL
jgi:hypothetical protein